MKTLIAIELEADDFMAGTDKARQLVIDEADFVVQRGELVKNRFSSTAAEPGPAKLGEMTEKVTREKVWLNAWCAVARAETCKSSGVAASWAEAALKEFDAKFPSPQSANHKS